MKVFVNGTGTALKKQWNEYFFLSDRFQHYYIIGNNPDLFKIPLITQRFVGTVMDLYVVGMALSVDQISDLFKGNIYQLTLFTLFSGSHNGMSNVKAFTDLFQNSTLYLVLQSV